MLSRISQLLDIATSFGINYRNAKLEKLYINIRNYSYDVLKSLANLDKVQGFINKTKKIPSLYNKMRDYEFFLEDFYLRSYILREKLYQLINVSLLNLPQKTESLWKHIESNDKTKDIHYALEKVFSDKTVSKVFKGRRFLTHRYYDVLSEDRELVDSLCGEVWSKDYYQNYYKQHSKIKNEEIKYTIRKFNNVANKIAEIILQKTDKLNKF